MYAIAEVYETDVGRLTLGQRATVSSAALPDQLTGRVERIRPIVRKQDQIGTDPAARKAAGGMIERPAQRPTKKQRRQIHRFKDGGLD